MLFLGRNILFFSPLPFSSNSSLARRLPKREIPEQSSLSDSDRVALSLSL
jgi:hypothetical protein